MNKKQDYQYNEKGNSVFNFMVYLLQAEGSDAIYIYPEGLKEILVHLKKDYQNPKIYITENGKLVNQINNTPTRLLVCLIFHVVPQFIL